jgi:amidase
MIQNPGGSSSGSAIAVSAGFSPISIGTETEGSLIMPGGRAALYTIRTTSGIVPMDGIVPISDVADSAGPMTKSVYDLAVLLDVIVDANKAKVPEGGYTAALTTSWSHLRVGVLEPAAEWVSSQEGFTKPDAGATKQMVNRIQPHIKFLLT